MLKRKSYLVLAAAAFATLPVASHAATVTFSYDLADMQVSADGGTTFLPAVFNAATNTVTVPAAGDIVEFGVDVTVTGNANPAATGTTGAGTYNAKKANQPANLGLAAYGFGMTDSNLAVANVVDSNPPGGPTTSLEGGGITGWSLFASGTVNDTTGGITTTAPESAANLAGNEVSTGTAGANTALFGAGGSGPAELLNSLSIQTSKAGTAIFTPSDQVAAGNVAIVQYSSGGSSTTTAGAPKYGNYTIVAGDGNVVNNLPALTLVVGGAITTSGPSPIVSLTAQGSQTIGGTSLPLLHVVGSNGSYVQAHDSVASLATANAEVTGFNPAGDNETYALKLSGSLTPTQIATIIADINVSSATDGVLALVPTADVASIAPGYQIELTATTSRSADQNIGFDFTQETNVAGVTVTDIIAVPEPASIGLLMGASGLVLGRRKRKA